MRAAVIGLGAAGARAARQLVSMPEVESVLLREVDPERAEAVRVSLGDKANVEVGADVIAPEADVVVLATPHLQHRAAAATALRAGCHVVSVADSMDDVEGLLELDHEARERGLSVVVGSGFSPGLSCVLAAFAASSFDEVDEIHVARVGTGGPACAAQHHRALAGHAVDWRDGGWTRRRGGSGRELMWFPDPIGGRDCYRAALPDALLLVPAFPTVQRVTVRLAAQRRDRLTAHLPMLRRPAMEAGPGALRVEVRGRRGVTRAVEVLGALDRPGLAAGAVAAVVARMAVAGELRRSGAAGLAEVVEPRAFLRDLRERGVRAAVFDGSLLTAT